MARPIIKTLKEHYKNEKLVGVEVGVKRGKNSISMLKNLDINRLYMVDCFKYYDGYNPKGYNHDSNLLFVQKHFKKYIKTGKVVLLPYMSDEAIKFIDGKVDFVYIDANHKYSFVKSDINNYFSIVKDGGFIGGHDFCAKNYNDVVRAVIEFANEKGLKVFGVSNDWWIHKLNCIRK